MMGQIMFGMSVFVLGVVMLSLVLDELITPIEEIDKQLTEIIKEDTTTNTQTDHSLETTTELNDEDLLSDSSLLDLGGI